MFSTGSHISSGASFHSSCARLSCRVAGQIPKGPVKVGGFTLQSQRHLQSPDSSKFKSNAANFNNAFSNTGGSGVE